MISNFSADGKVPFDPDQNIPANDLLDEDYIEFLKSEADPAAWTSDETIHRLAGIYPIKTEWVKLVAAMHSLGLKSLVYAVEKAVKQYRDVLQTHTNAHETPSTAPVSTDATQPKRFNTISAKELLAKKIAPITEVVDDILPAGLTLFSGKAKDGKTRAASDVSLAVATGGKVFGRYGVKQGTVLCLLLEDGERRAQARLQEYLEALHVDRTPENLHFVLWESPRVGEGFEECLASWLTDHPDTQLIVVDILEKVRPKRGKHEPLYAMDYAALAPMQKLAQEANIAILVITHSNKGKHEDARDTISGTMGLSGACDTIWTLKRVAGKADAELHVTGRDVEERTLAMQFKDGFWAALDPVDTLSDAQQEILVILRGAQAPMSIRALHQALPGITYEAIRKRVFRLVRDGILTRDASGSVSLRNHSSSPTSSLYTSQGGGEEVEGAGSESVEKGKSGVQGLYGVQGVQGVQRLYGTSGTSPDKVRVHPNYQGNNELLDHTTHTTHTTTHVPNTEGAGQKLTHVHTHGSNTDDQEAWDFALGMAQDSVD